MIVYVESNFILEIALEQNQATAAESILALAESGQIELAFSAFALSEPFSTITRRWKERDRLLESTGLELQQIARAGKYKPLENEYRDLFGRLRQIKLVNLDLLEKVTSRMLGAGRAIGSEGSYFGQKFPEYKNRYELSLPDAIIYTSVIYDLQQQQSQKAKCFVSRDEAAFGRKSSHFLEIETELQSYNCRYRNGFEAALNLVNIELSQPQKLDNISQTSTEGE